MSSKSSSPTSTKSSDGQPSTGTSSHKPPAKSKPTPSNPKKIKMSASSDCIAELDSLVTATLNPPGANSAGGVGATSSTGAGQRSQPASATTGAAQDTSSLTRRVSEHVDYLSYKFDPFDLHSTWKVATKKKDSVHSKSHPVNLNHAHPRRVDRLENASWRKFFQTRFNIPTIPPSKLNWEKNADINWLYGPFHTYEPLPVLEARYLDKSSTDLSSSAGHRASSGLPKPSLKKRRNSRQEFINSLRKQQQSSGGGKGSSSGSLKRVESDSRLASKHRVMFTNIESTDDDDEDVEHHNMGRTSGGGGGIRGKKGGKLAQGYSSTTDGESSADESDASSHSSISSATAKSVGKLLKFQAYEGSRLYIHRASPVFTVGGGDSPLPEDEDEGEGGTRRGTSRPPPNGEPKFSSASMDHYENTEGYGWIDRIADTVKNVRDCLIWAKSALSGNIV